MEKPLGYKSYGSIPHLPGSRRGPSDRGISEAQARYCTDPRHNPDGKKRTVIVQEKLDGSNCGVAKLNDEIIALGHAGYRADSSGYEMHHRFAAWVASHEDLFRSLLLDGERVCGEWMAQAHGTIYAPLLSEMWLFRPFDLMWGIDRVPYARFCDRVKDCGFVPVHTLSVGPAVSVEDALSMLETQPGSLPTADGSLREGCVWRVERDTKAGRVVDFLAKYVRPEKVDGFYLHGDPVWVEVASQ